MKKIFILGLSRTASKLYREIINKSKDAYILHEILFSFRFKKDINSIFQKHRVYKDKTRLTDAVDEIYSLPYFRYLKWEFPEKEDFLKVFNNLDKLDWVNALNNILVQKAKSVERSITGAKNPVHFSYAKRILRNFSNVKMLYLVRDPRAMYASELPMKSGEYELSQFPKIKSRFVLRILIFIYINFEWIWAMIIYQRIKKYVLLCKYEDMILNPKETLSTVFNYCEINFLEEYLEGIPVINSSHNFNEAKGFSKHGLDKWKNVLNRFEIFWFKTLIKFFKY